LSYLLDTNTWIAWLRWQNAGVLQQLKQTPPHEILLCSIVLGELWYGAERSAPTRRVSNIFIVDSLRAKYRSLALDDAAAREYARIRAELAQQGKLIGPNDMLIAAIAVANAVTLVSNNTSEFGRVSGLKVIDWQTP
jgi:tRNA(fMet)-specific endonuclease VapC